MYELSKIREGSYFPIYQLSNIKNVWIELFGAEVTMIEKYPQLIVETFNYSIVNLYGQKWILLKVQNMNIKLKLSN